MSEMYKQVLTEKEVEIILLKNFVENEEYEIPDTLQNILDGLYENILNNELPLFLRESISNATELEELIEGNIESDVCTYVSWLYTGVSSLLHFVQCNWTGPLVNNDIEWLKPQREYAIKKLSLHDECNSNVKKPELLYFAKLVFTNSHLQNAYTSCVWWLFRSNLLHQHILNESLGILFNELEELLTKIQESTVLNNEYCKVLFEIEAAHFYFYYRRIQNSEKFVDSAQATAKLNTHLEGALGKRTKYQIEEKAQLYLNITVEKDSFSFKECDNLPKSLELNDDLRLEQVEFTKEPKAIKTGPIEEAIILAKFMQLKLSNPKDKLTDEELNPYINAIVENTQNWSLKVSSLCHRCLLESTDKRSAERAMMQMEYLIHEIQAAKVPTARRMDLVFASGLTPIWTLEQIWANLMFGLGLVKGALDVYTKLELWEDTITCYNLLNLKHKAAEIIRQELSKKPTVQLWCLLGDAEQDPSHYNTAWVLSGEKSSRAQRHWGFFYFAKNNYKEAIPHLKLSVELNNIQETVWIRLGFAALQVEDWKLAATAYRRYCVLEPSTFEAWNNLAKAYIKLGDKSRAWKSLQDAIKCDYDRWQVWDNLMVVSIDLKHFGEVIRSYHRILDLKNHHLDVQVLEILSNSIIMDINDSDGNSSRKLLQKALELFGRISSIIPNNPDIWRMYAQLLALKKTEIDDQKVAQYLQLAHRSATANPLWSKQEETTKDVLSLCDLLAAAYLQCASQSEIDRKRSLLGSAKLSLQGVVKKVKEQEWTNEIINQNLQNLELHLNTIIQELDQIKFTN